MNNTSLRLTFLLICCLSLLIVNPAFSQQPASVSANPLSVAPVKQSPPFWNEIAEFKHQDSVQRPPSGAILFVGSSSFRKWTNLQSYFPGYTIINRGFGGSTLPDVIRYANDIIFPYHPKEIVIYCGENDFAADS